MTTPKANCWKCRFFQISWDPKFPYECEAMHFKSQHLPCIQVMSIDGRECQWFQPKPDPDRETKDASKKGRIKGRQTDQYV
jgi:hypothetical protein